MVNRIAVLVADGFEQIQLDAALRALTRLEIEVEVLASSQDELSSGIRGLNHIKPAQGILPHRLISQVVPDDYSGLLVPGGALSVDTMRKSLLHLSFAKVFLKLGKALAVIGHGAWLLADSGALFGYTLTSWPTIRKDLERAGAIWKDAPTLRDRRLFTSQGAVEQAEFWGPFVQATRCQDELPRAKLEAW